MIYAATAFLLGLLFLIVLLRAAPRYGLVDPPSVRKSHEGEVPFVGGLAIAASFLVTALIQYPSSPSFVPFMVACGVILATGLLDDLREMSPRFKLGGQLFAALLMTYWADLSLVNLGDLWGAGEVVLNGWVATAFTLFCVVGILNAMNMIDGLDGLAGGIAAVAAVWLCLGAGAQTPMEAASLLCALAAATFAFLLFNLRHPWRRRASVFLGDTGSMFLGFVLVWFAVDLSQTRPNNFYPISAVWVLGIPILDTVYLMLRRLGRRRSPFEPDRRHVHHTLIYMGLSHAQTAAALIAVSALFGAIGFFGWLLEIPEFVLTYLFLAIFVLYCLFMQYWRQLLSVFGIRHRRPAVASDTSPLRTSVTEPMGRVPSGTQASRVE